MGTYKYEIVLTNGLVNQKYQITALCERAAIILAQAEAIKAGRGYNFVSAKVKNDKADGFIFTMGDLIPIRIIGKNERMTIVKPIV